MDTPRADLLTNPISQDHFVRDSECLFKCVGFMGRILPGKLEEEIEAYKGRGTRLLFAKPQQQVDQTAPRVFIPAVLEGPNPVSFTIMQYAGGPDSSITAYGIGGVVEQLVVEVSNAITMISDPPTSGFRENFFAETVIRKQMYRRVLAALGTPEGAAVVLSATFRQQLKEQYGVP